MSWMRPPADTRAESWRRRIQHAMGPFRPLLYRCEPLSDDWGYERGTPIDRLYIERFLAGHAGDIRGQVLEVHDRSYTDQYGEAVTGSDVLDIDSENPRATMVADLEHGDAIPTGTFDCFVFTQTLHYMVNPARALAHAHRILRPGGVLLATMPSIIRLDTGLPDADRWRFTTTSCRELLTEAFGSGTVDVRAEGNFAAAVSFLAGMAAEELGPARLAEHDPRFPVVILARGVKAVTASNR